MASQVVLFSARKAGMNSFKKFLRDYYEDTPSPVRAWECMQSDLDNGHVPNEFKTLLSRYLGAVQDKVDEACCNYIFSKG